MVIKSYFLLDKTIEYDGMTATIVVCDDKKTKSVQPTVPYKTLCSVVPCADSVVPTASSTKITRINSESHKNHSDKF